MYSNEEIDKILEKRDVPVKLLAVLRPNNNFWELKYVHSDIIKNTRKLEGK